MPKVLMYCFLRRDMLEEGEGPGKERLKQQ